ncbi:hypothetical protein N8Z09_02675 [Methylophilaceae bacterium]|nr:hypothetical protein [Methylophilaceae bacterium]
MIDIFEVAKYIESQGPNSKIYIGGDSHRFQKSGEKKKWYAEYTMVVVVHKNGNNGCKIFGENSIEPDYDAVQNKPRLRLMNEVYKIADLYLQLNDIIGDRAIEIHLDINAKEGAGSSCVVQQAVGYIRGVCNVIPMTKPKAFAASCAADRAKELKLAV